MSNYLELNLNVLHLDFVHSEEWSQLLHGILVDLSDKVSDQIPVSTPLRNVVDTVDHVVYLKSRLESFLLPFHELLLEATLLQFDGLDLLDELGKGLLVYFTLGVFGLDAALQGLDSKVKLLV